MSKITTHVLDTAAGKPASGIRVELAMRRADSWEDLGTGVTDSDGRARSLLKDGYVLQAGVYRLVFNTSTVSKFFPEIVIQFEITSVEQHYHVPLLLSPYGYSTYRGS